MARTPKVPGEVTEAVESTDPVEAAQAEETVTVSKSTLEALMSRIDALESRKASKSVVQETKLPDQDDIDPKSIKTPVLSKQGWVVPENYGENPAAKK